MMAEDPWVDEALRSPPTNPDGTPRTDVAFVRARRPRWGDLPAVSARWAVPLAPTVADEVCAFLRRNTPAPLPVLGVKWRIEWTNGAGEALPGGRQRTLRPEAAPEPAPEVPDDEWAYPPPLPLPERDPMSSPPPPAPARVVVEAAPLAPIPGELPIPLPVEGARAVDPQAARKMIQSGEPALALVGSVLLLSDRLTAAAEARATGAERAAEAARTADRQLLERVLGFAEKVTATTAAESQGMGKAALGSVGELGRVVAGMQDGRDQKVGELVGVALAAHKEASEARAEAKIQAAIKAVRGEDATDADAADMLAVIKEGRELWSAFRGGPEGGGGLLAAFAKTWQTRKFEPLLSYLDTAPAAEVAQLETFMTKAVPVLMEWKAKKAAAAAASAAGGGA